MATMKTTETLVREYSHALALPVQRRETTGSARLPNYFRWKFLVDYSLAAALLIPCLAIIGLLVLLIRLTSRGPGIYHQTRVGKDGRWFTFYKLRTMRVDSESDTGAVWSTTNDPRVTFVGRVLRKWHLDEFPQVFNVLKGDMSLVGPRPERPEFVSMLNDKISRYHERLAVPPGVTGLAQLNLPPDSDLNDVHRKLALDLEYLERAGFLLDVRIILCTFARMLKLPALRILGLRRQVPSFVTPYFRPAGEAGGRGVRARPPVENHFPVDYPCPSTALCRACGNRMARNTRRIEMIRQSQPNDGSTPDLPSGLLYADLLRGAWRRKFRVLLGLLLGLAAGALCWTHWPPTYESRVQLLVVKKKAPDARVAGVAPQLPEFDDYVSAQKALLSSPLIVHKAVQEGHLHQLKSLQAAADPTAAIILGLTVTRDPADRPESALLTLAYRGPSQQECKIVVEAIVASYREYLAETQTSAVAEIERIFAQWRDEVQEGIARKQEVYRTLREATPAAQWTGKGGVNLAETRFAQLEAQRLAQSVRQTELQGRLTALAQVQRAGASHEELAQMISLWSERSRNSMDKETEISQKVDVNLHEQLLLLKLQEQSLPESYGPAHPRAKAIREQVHLAEQMLLRQNGAEAPSTPTRSGSAAVLPDVLVKTYLATLEKDLQIATELEQSLSELTRAEQERAQKINDVNEDMEALRGQITSTEGLQQQITQHLQSLSASRDSDVYHAQVLSPAGEGLQVVPKLWLVFPLAALLGLLLGATLAYAAEVADESFRTPAEIRERLRLPVIAHTEYCRTPNRKQRQAKHNGRKLDSVLCTYFVPDSAVSEAYRRVRSMLCLGRNGGPKPVVQVTSPNRGDGSSTVSANLAVSLAQTGRRVVLVDADFRRPSLHGVFGLSPEAGITSVLAGQADLSDAIQSTSVENLSLLPCGPVSPESAELLSRDKFERLLDELRSRFDFVLIDTPPVLGTSDACVVAHHADFVLLALRNTKHVRPLAEQAVQTLTDQEARLIGIVVNNPARGGSRNHGYATRQQRYS